MRPANRLFRIMLILGRGRVVTAQRMSEQLEVSLRTVYRDVRTLMESGVPVDGEAGVGYTLRRDFYLPPLMFTDTEVQALALGAQMVQSCGDSNMCKAAGQALDKIEVSLPAHLKAVLNQVKPDDLQYASVPA